MSLDGRIYDGAISKLTKAFNKLPVKEVDGLNYLRGMYQPKSKEPVEYVIEDDLER